MRAILAFQSLSTSGTRIHEDQATKTTFWLSLSAPDTTLKTRHTHTQPSVFRIPFAAGTLELLFPSRHLGKDQGTHSDLVIGDIKNPELRPIKVSQGGGSFIQHSQSPPNLPISLSVSSQGHPRFFPRSPHQPPPAFCHVDNRLDFFCRSPQPASTATHAEMALVGGSNSERGHHYHSMGSC